LQSCRLAKKKFTALVITSQLFILGLGIGLLLMPYLNGIYDAHGAFGDGELIKMISCGAGIWTSSFKDQGFTNNTYKARRLVYIRNC
jgi:hypothetical protein